MGFNVRGHPVGWISVYASFIAAVAGCLFGYDMGYSSSILIDNDALTRFATDHKNCVMTPNGAGGQSCVPQWQPYVEGIMVGLLSIGCMVGCFFSPYLADWSGRRRAMQMETIIFFVGIIIQATSQWSWVQFGMGRLIAGFGVGALSAITPPFISELVPREIRGMCVASYQAMIFAGIFLGYVIDIASRDIKGPLGTTKRSATWRIPVCIALVFGLTLFIGSFFCPESPRFDAHKGRRDQVRKTIARTRGLNPEDRHPLLDEEVEEIMANADAERTNPTGWLDCFKPKNRQLYRTFLCCALQMGQQLAGANYLYYFGAQVLKPVGVTDSGVTQLIFGAVSLVCELPGLYLLEFVGRRTPLIVGGLWMFGWMLAYAIAGTVGNTGTPADPTISKPVGTFMIVSACLALLGYASTWAPGIWLVCGETGAPKTRAKQAGLAAMVNWLWNFLLAFFTPPITDNIGYAYGFVFAGCNLAFAAFTYLFLYETRNLTLEQINVMYNDPTCKPWNSAGWTPPALGDLDDVKSGEDKHSADSEKFVGQWTAEPTTHLVNEFPVHDDKKLS